MSRSGYSDDYDAWATICWRGAVLRATNGRRGQAFLRELLTALDEMEVKRLISNDLITKSGDVCTLGALGKKRGIDMAAIDPDDSACVGAAFGVAGSLAAEIEYMNDEFMSRQETPEARYSRMRAWVQSSILDPAKAKEDLP